MVNPSDVRVHMEVLGSDGSRVGRVDGVEGQSLKLTKDSPEARGEHRFIPLDWVASVDQAVRLSRPARDVQQEWQAHPVQKGEYLPPK